MRSDLSGTVSLVTGAARGIGQAIADRLASNGSTVIYTDVDESGARAPLPHKPWRIRSLASTSRGRRISRRSSTRSFPNTVDSTSSSTTPESTPWRTALRSMNSRAKSGTASSRST